MNKSEKIREYKAANPDATAPQIQAALKREKIAVSLPLIYQILAKKAKPTRATTNGKSDVSVSSLLEVKKAVSAIGSIDEARKALDLLAKLSS